MTLFEAQLGSMVPDGKVRAPALVGRSGCQGCPGCRQLRLFTFPNWNRKTKSPTLSHDTATTRLFHSDSYRSPHNVCPCRSTTSLGTRTNPLFLPDRPSTRQRRVCNMPPSRTLRRCKADREDCCTQDCQKQNGACQTGAKGKLPSVYIHLHHGKQLLMCDDNTIVCNRVTAPLQTKASKHCSFPPCLFI